MSDIVDNETTESQAPASEEPEAQAPEAMNESPAVQAAPAGEQSGSPAPAQGGGERTDAREPSRERTDRRPPRRDSGDSRERGQGDYAARVPRFKRKVCLFCQERDVKIDYKRPDILERFITDRGKILPRRVTGTCSKHQRHVAREIKRARIIALLPFVEQ